ncbi:MAG: QueT transporter [Haloquadratum sp. J07HQX50]|nr:MAG: QueT transporter [Haloquadratum sp. J07HQX50]
MRELLTMWRETRMIMLVAVTAAVYAAVLIPFQTFQIIPGITSIRPANVFPVVFGILFGPAAAWGSAIGNLIGDIFGGTFGPGSVGGFVGNFAYGLVGYKLWGNLSPLSSGTEPNFRGKIGRQLVEYGIIAITASALCAVIISWVVDVLGLVPFAVLGPTILINNAVASVVLGPPLLYLTYPRIKEMGLLYPDLLRGDDLPSPRSGVNLISAWGLVAVSLLWLGGGILISTGAAPGAISVAVIGAIGFIISVIGAGMTRERFSRMI